MAGERRRRIRPEEQPNIQVPDPAPSRYVLPEQSRSSRTGPGFPNRGEAIAQVEERGHAVEKNRVIPFQTEDEEEGWNESGRSAEKKKPRKASAGKKTRKKRSVLLLISAVIGTLYTIYLITYFMGISTTTTGTEALGANLATAIVLPHIALTALAALFNWIGYLTCVRGFALTGAILYCVAAFVFFMYALFVVPEIILSFAGFIRMKRQE